MKFLRPRFTAVLPIFVAVVFIATTLVSVDKNTGDLRIEDPQYPVLNYQYSLERGIQRYLDLDKVTLIVNSSGKPVSNKITDDVSLVTVHTFDLFPVILTHPTRSATDGLWRVMGWVSSGSNPQSFGYVVTIVLGYDDTVIEYDLLPGYVFDYKSGRTETISEVSVALRPGEQIFMHIIGEHSFTQADIDAIGELGFDYPQLVLGHQETNMTILTALKLGQNPLDGEIRGLGLIYRGQN